MRDIFSDFQHLNGTTWFYLSFLLMIIVYFRFSRVLSLRNWDLITLFLFVPGLLATAKFDRGALQARRSPLPVALDENMLYYGYVCLFVVTGYFLCRCLVDLFLLRRPRLEPNLNTGGLAFLCFALYGFMMYEVVTKEPDPGGRASAQVALKWLHGEFRRNDEEKSSNPIIEIVASPIVAVTLGAQGQITNGPQVPQTGEDIALGAARSMVTLCHLFILAALILIGWQHFGSPLIGISMATLFPLLPLTAINVEKLDHLLPSALLVWAVYAFRRPTVSGALLGVAGVFVYPLFLLPLWIGFYWNRGAVRFLVSFLTVTLSLSLLVEIMDPLRSFMHLWSPSVAWKIWDFVHQDPTALGFWTQSTQIYRLPIFVAFFIFVIAVGFVPKEKNLAELIALSVAIILAIQFWYPDRGGTYIHWFLPLLLLMIFRPSLSGVRPPEIVPKPT